MISRRIFAILLVSASVAAAQTAPTKAEVRAKRVIDDAIEALGGEKFLTMQDRTETGHAYSFYRDQISGRSIATIYTRYITAPAGQTGDVLAQREREAFGKDEESSVLFTEKGGWEITWHGTKELPKDEVDRYRETTLRNIFYILRERLHEPGMIFESRGADVVENQPVDVVDITDSEDRVVTVDFNQDTRLPIRQTYTQYNQQTKERDEIVALYTRYQDVNGIQWPHQIHRERNGDKVYEIFSNSVQINKDLTDELFSLPAEGSNPAKPPKKKK